MININPLASVRFEGNKAQSKHKVSPSPAFKGNLSQDVFVSSQNKVTFKGLLWSRKDPQFDTNLQTHVKNDILGKANAQEDLKAFAEENKVSNRKLKKVRAKVLPQVLDELVDKAIMGDQPSFAKLVEVSNKEGLKKEQTRERINSVYDGIIKTIMVGRPSEEQWNLFIKQNGARKLVNKVIDNYVMYRADIDRASDVIRCADEHLFAEASEEVYHDSLQQLDRVLKLKPELTETVIEELQKNLQQLGTYRNTRIAQRVGHIAKDLISRLN